jgi:hypothetical protein
VWHLFGLDCIQFRMKVPLDYFFLNLTPNFPMCQKRQEGIRRSNICILRTKAKEMMNESRISRAVVVATSSLIVWGS